MKDWASPLHSGSFNDPDGDARRHCGIRYPIFSHEAQFKEYEKDRTKLENLQAEYAQIKDCLEELVKRRVISKYIKRTLIEMPNKVLEHIARKHDTVKEGVKTAMV